MKTLFYPAVALMNRLHYPIKLILLGSIAAVAIAFLTLQLVNQSIAIKDFSHKELLGIEYINPLRKVIDQLQLYRKLEVEFLLGNQSVQTSLDNTQDEIDRAIALVDAKDARLGTILSTTAKWNKIKSSWNELKVSIPQDNKRSNFAALSKLINSSQNLIISTCDTSNLTLDPDIDTYYSMDSYCTKIPNFSEEAALMRDLGLGVISLKTLSTEDQKQLFINQTLMDNFNKEGIKGNLEKVIAERPELSTTFDPLMQVLLSQTRNALQLLNTTIMNNNFDVTPEKYAGTFTSLLNSSTKLYDETAKNLYIMIQERVDNIQFKLYTNIAIVVLSLLILAYLFVGLYISVMNSIKELIKGSEKLASGDLAAPVKLDTQDELRTVAASFNAMRDSLSKIINELHTVIADTTGVLNNVSKGDLTSKITKDYKGAFGDLKKYVNITVESLEKLIRNIHVATKTIHDEASSIAIDNNNLAKRTEQQAAFLEETAASIEEVTATVKQNAENAKNANQFAKSASDVAIRGGTVVSQVVQTMTTIHESSNKVTDIIGVIDHIAFQTNILALNAAVEAARAGEQGRGFAVVASEVRNLAQRTSVAAKEIKVLISDSVEKVTGGTKLVDEAGKTMEEIVKAVNKVTEIMSEIANSSMEQSNGIEQVNLAVAQMDQVTQQNSTMVENAAKAAKSMENQTRHMNQLISQFKLQIQEEESKDEEPKIENEQKEEQVSNEDGNPILKKKNPIWTEF